MTTDFISRLEDEQELLLLRWNKLSTFMRSSEFYQLSEIHQTLLRLQANTMNQYLTILKARLGLLRTPKPIEPIDEPVIIEHNTFDIDRDGPPD
jgi:hypothetical protein